MKLFTTFLLFLLVACGKTQTLPINSGVPAISINAAGQPSTITINKGPHYFDPVSGDITFTDAHFQYSVPGVAETGFTRRSPGGFVKFRTSETSIDVKVGGDWSTASSSFDNQSAIEVLVNDVWNQSVTLTSDNTTQTYTITLPAGEKIVELRNGYTANPNGSDLNIPDEGVYVQGVNVTGDIEIQVPQPPTNLWYIIGNSIPTGASGTHPLINGWPMLLRAEGWEVELNTFGGRRLLTFDPEDAGDMAAYIANRVPNSPNHTIINELGTNNFGLAGGQSKAVFKTEYENFLDSLHEALPLVRIICISPFNRTTYLTPNGAGATCEDYADAIQEVIADGRSWAEFIYGKDLVSLANLIDGLHPDDTGHLEIRDNLKTAIEAL